MRRRRLWRGELDVIAGQPVKGLEKLPFPTRSIQCDGIHGMRFRESGDNVSTADNAMECQAKHEG